MAATPPRPATPASRPNVVVPKSNNHALQISPNLEALLQHDELTRRNSGSSPTTGPGSTTTTNTTTPSEFPISLPPPPPRKVQGLRKASQREQEAFHLARSKEEKRKIQRTAIDCWPNALPTAFPPDDGRSTTVTCSNSSRPVSPNPYINPTPVLRTDHDNNDDADVVDDDAPMPRHAEFSEHLARSVTDSSRSTTFSSSDPSHCRPSSASNKKVLWMGRDSLSLFTGSARHAQLRRGEYGDVPDAVQDRQMRQVPAHCVSRPPFGDPFDTATVVSPSPSSSSSSSPYLPQGSVPDPTFEFASARSHPIKSDFDPTKDPSPVHPHPTAFLPRLSLPSIFMSHHSPSRSTRPADIADSGSSFIDFFSPSMSEDADNSCITHPSSSRPKLDSLHTLSRCNSSTTLASMRFAPPPSPTASELHHPAPSYCRTESSASSITLSSMKFAPPSPSIDRVPPTRLQPLSGPPSPYSPLEFAPPPSPLYEDVEKPSPSIAPAELVPERGSRPKSKKRSMSSSPRAVCHSRPSLPPTTNQLGANERADRIRRNRKLARVFGRMPGTEDSVTELDEPRQLSKKLHSPALAALLSKQKIHRQAMSVSVAVKTPGLKTEPSTPWQTDGLWSSGDRRHSTPLATGSFKLFVGNDGEAEDPFNRVDTPDAASTRSFMDLSDEEARDDDDDVSSISYLTPQPTRRRLQHSNSVPSLVESLDSEAQAEAEKRRKREKLARLHRFLGSRVPLEAVNGCAIGPPLPPLAVSEQADYEHRLRGTRKSASLDEFDRGREELDEREKARNVRRAQKMERVFGAPPPQTLFHTRTMRPTVPAPRSPSVNPYVLTLDLPSSSRNQNQSAYMGKRIHRPGPSDSSRCLLSRAEDTPQSSPSSLAQSFADSLFVEPPGYQQILAQSTVYLNYQHSLNSLIDIIDRDDRQSLVELYRFLRGKSSDDDSSDEEVPVQPVSARRISAAASLKSERRHSLPTSASMTSLSSEFACPQQISPFQIRRRKAAKLTNFFGVDYRELIDDILESIEKGVEDERNHGTLQPQEVEVLMHRVRSLRSISASDDM